MIRGMIEGIIKGMIKGMMMKKKHVVLSLALFLVVLLLLFASTVVAAKEDRVDIGQEYTLDPTTRKIYQGDAPIPIGTLKPDVAISEMTFLTVDDIEWKITSARPSEDTEFMFQLPEGTVLTDPDVLDFLEETPDTGLIEELAAEEPTESKESEEARKIAARREAYHSISGNPSEWYDACTKEKCGPMDVTIDNNGDIYADFKGDRVELDYDCPNCEGLDKCDPYCDAGLIFEKGNAVVDKDGNRYESQGVEYVMTDADGTKRPATPDEVDDCAAAENCKIRSKGFKATHYYWTPNSWTDFLRGGPAVQTWRSISSLIPGAGDIFGWKAYLDRYFNLEQWTITDVCYAGYRNMVNRGVGVSPYGSGIPTATIQAQKFRVEPCLGLEGVAKDSCIKNQSLAHGEYYWVYRITGKVIPKDCGMEFNIYLETESGEQMELYGETRVAEQGAPSFDLTGANAIVTEKKDLPEFTKVCIDFKGSMVTCIRTGFTDSGKICNKVYESGDESITQRATEKEPETLGRTSYTEGGPSTSATEDGRNF